MLRRRYRLWLPAAPASFPRKRESSLAHDAAGGAVGVAGRPDTEPPRSNLDACLRRHDTPDKDQAIVTLRNVSY